MHVLSVFPELLTYSLLAPFILRITVGVLGLFAGKDCYKKEYSWMGILYIIASLMIIVGLYTQIVVLVGLLFVSFDYYVEKKKGLISRERLALSILIKIVLISLLVTGPGFLAFDYPL